ncbi:MAG: hypothetical protein PHQ66_02630 [Candidatus Nanoarchaeia archaeon]|nr:hypothetical protein [Candidatus Nanoarchaeia archaeon]MDD5357737.1 hypothetical protein [Candidatus Nanoarchaeia archaeon]MDD5588656.1 hypothetical protein [Candidatus Nanoarchaeia archaeon]
MKKKKELVIRIDNRLLYTIIAFGILAAVAVGVYAYGTSSPSVFGHSVGELNFSDAIRGNMNVEGGITATGRVSAADVKITNEVFYWKFGLNKNCNDVCGAATKGIKTNTGICIAAWSAPGGGSDSKSICTVTLAYAECLCVGMYSSA